MYRSMAQKTTSTFQLNHTSRFFLSCLAVLIFFFSSSFVGNPAASKNSSDTPEQFKDVGVDEKLGKKIPIENLTFTNEEGKKVKFSSFFKDKKPVILIFAYYECPMLCTLVLNGFTVSAKNLAWSIGKEYEVVVVSINPKEKPEVAKAKKKNYLGQYGRLSAHEGWHFLTGDDKNIKDLAEAAGYKFKYDPKIKQYAHAALLTFLTPKGKISRYLYGIHFKHNDLKLAIQEAADGTIGTVMERLLLFCFQYNPDSDSYSFTVLYIMEIAGILTLLIFGGYLFRFWRREIKLARRAKKKKDEDS